MPTAQSWSITSSSGTKDGVSAEAFSGLTSTFSPLVAPTLVKLKKDCIGEMNSGRETDLPDYNKVRRLDITYVCVYNNVRTYVCISK